MSDFECLPIGTAARLKKLEAEVERLRSEANLLEIGVDGLRSDNERLRALLRDWSGQR